MELIKTKRTRTCFLHVFVILENVVRGLAPWGPGAALRDGLILVSLAWEMVGGKERGLISF
jgi:hypothetical protein